MSLPEVANLVETCGCFGLVWQASALRFSFEAIKAIKNFTNWEIEKGQEADVHLRKLADARMFIESVRV